MIDVDNLDINTFYGRTIDYLWNRGLLFAILAVCGWLLLGTLFYAYYDGFGLRGGFNYAVSLSFTIGWQTDLTEIDDWSYLFSTLYIFGGILMISAVLIYISHLEKIHNTRWYVTRAKHLKRIEQLPQLVTGSREGQWLRWKIFYRENHSAILSWQLLIAYVILGVIITALHDDVDVIKAIYYIMSTLSTTGVYDPYIESKGDYFTLTSLYAIGGILIGSVAIVYLSQGMVKYLMYERLDRHIKVPMPHEEFDALKQMKVLEEGKPITRQAYLIMMAIRMELMDEEFISYIFEKYDHQSSTLLATNSVRDLTSNPIREYDSDEDESTKLV